METESQISRELRVGNDLGMHARPAAILAKAAQKFSCKIVLESDGQEVDAKSILDILTLSLGKGKRVVVKAEGPDAEKALDHLAHLFEDRFGE